MARNGPDFFTERFRKGLPTSVDELEWQSPILMGLDELGLAPTIKAHSIIADRRDPPGPAGATAWSRTRVRISTGWRPSRSCRPATCARTIPPSSARSGGSSRSMGPRDGCRGIERGVVSARRCGSTRHGPRTFIPDSPLPILEDEWYDRTDLQDDPRRRNSHDPRPDQL